MRIRFGVRSVFIATALFASIFGWVAYMTECGRRELNAAGDLRDGGIITLQSECTGLISVSSPFTIWSGTTSFPGTEMSVLAAFMPAPRGFFQRIFGDEFRVRFSTIIIYDKPAIEMAQIESCIKALPNLTTVYIDPSALAPVEVKYLQSMFPNLMYEIRPTVIPPEYRNKPNAG